MFHRISRRRFVQAGTIAGAGFLVAFGNNKKQARASALQSIAVAGIGVGGKGTGDIEQAGYYGKVVALCDTDRNILDGMAQRFDSPRTFTDYRDLFAEMDDKIDACTVSTPDHMHAVQSAAAMKLGKHVYTQKPLTRSITEARFLGRLAKEKGVCTQMGNQGSVEDWLRKEAALYRAGVVGQVQEIHIWTNRPIWPQAPNRGVTMAQFSEEMTATDPENAEELIQEKKQQVEAALGVVDWEHWLGVSPKREYWPGVYHPFAWRGWWDFGTGALGDIACHSFNLFCKGLDLKNPVRAVATTSGHDFNSFPSSSVVEIDFAENECRGPVKFFWYDAKQTPSLELTKKYALPDYDPNGGALVIGDKGASLYGQFKAEGGTDLPVPEVEFEIAPIDDEKRGGDARHKFEWMQAISENRPELCWSNFPEQAGPLTESVLLGNLATWTAYKPNVQGEVICWDPVNAKITNAAEITTPGLDKVLTPKYEDGYSLE
ncbi:MAG: Gfo/Idh/MocA family oxidoreductase [Planctomycetia bacterium]|nr:Gfo/Idh/MocA family oxidoreductase [Planctomycetia bacterium]